MSDFFKTLVKGLKDEETIFAADSKNSLEYDGTIDTGSYLLNAAISTSINGGVIGNRITGIAGDEATGKTFFALGMVRKWLEDNPTGACFYFDTEHAISKEMLEERDIDVSRVIISEQVSVQQFRHRSLQILDSYLEKPKDERPPMIFVLDSMGQLSTTKELEDTAEGAETRDMTRAQVLKATFRVLNLKLSKAGVPLIVTNHTYATMDKYSPREMSGGCLVAGTKIIMEDGSLKNIEDIEVGETVNTKDGPSQVIEAHKFKNENLLEIEFIDGYKVKCTPEHKFLIGEKWVQASELSIGDNVEEV